MRGLARTCVMWVKGCPVEREPFSSAPAPYLSVCPLNFPPCLFASAIPSTLFLLVFHNVGTERTKHTLSSPISHSSPNTHLRNLPSLFLSFHPFPPFISLILSQLYGCLMLSPCCRERTEHPSSSGGMVVMLAGGGASPHALL